jgi:hypothetical protein
MAVAKNIKLFFGMRRVVGNRLNPVYLAIATSGYRIQSRLLRIPDRYGDRYDFLCIVFDAHKTEPQA